MKGHAGCPLFTKAKRLDRGAAKASLTRRRSPIQAVCCPQFPASQFPAPVPCPQFPVPSSLSPVPCPSSLLQLVPSSLSQVPCPQFAACPPCSLPQFPAPSSLSPVPCPSSLSPVCCLQFPAQVPCPSSLPPVPCASLLPPVPCPSSLFPVCCLPCPPLPCPSSLLPLACPQFPVPSSLSPFCCLPFFFHEYGRRVGMVPRSSLKEGKNSQMVEKRTKTPKPNQHQQTPQARRPNLHHLVVFPLHWVKRVKQKLMAIKGLNSRKTRTTAQVCGQGKSPRRLQTDYPSRILVTSSHTTVRQNKVTLQVGCLAMLKRR